MSRYFDVLRLRDFRLYWLGFTGSWTGDEITRVALVWYVYESTRSAEAVGWLMACFSGPVVIGGFLAGWALDRFERRRVMLIDALMRASVMAAIPVLQALGALDLWHAYVAALVYGLLYMIPLAGMPALVPAMVPADRIGTANAMEMLGYAIGSVVGPVVAGYAIARVGAPAAMWLDVASYLGFAFCLWRMSRIPPAAAPAAPTARASAGFGPAAALVFRQPVLLATTSMFFCSQIGIGMLAVWLPILSTEFLQGDAKLYGLLVGAEASGQLLGVLVVGALATEGRLGLRICLAMMAAGVFLLAMMAFGRTVWVVALLLAAHGSVRSPLTVWAQTLRMAAIPPPLGGRTFALLRMVMQTGRPIGGAVGGHALATLGVLGSIGASAALVGLPGALGLLVGPLRRAAR
ncbi:MAG: MFS transporter [Alphaproteobacteria bacterium]|nr:MFS transporter [Alphaproteobacteria bacterium]